MLRLSIILGHANFDDNLGRGVHRKSRHLYRFYRKKKKLRQQQLPLFVLLHLSNYFRLWLIGVCAYKCM